MRYSNQHVTLTRVVAVRCRTLGKEGLEYPVLRGAGVPYAKRGWSTLGNEGLQYPIQRWVGVP